jgi:epoxyqueuosine reductase
MIERAWKEAPVQTERSLAERSLAIAREAGACLAAWVPLSALQEPAPHLLGDQRTPTRRGSLLVLAVEHPETDPELDWWGGSGGTEGNRRLIAISEQVKRFLVRSSDAKTTPLPYHPWKGGVLLKDAAVLAGLGCIGVNNLLITPQYGPRVRLRALYADLEVAPSHAPQFAPCATCPRPCWQACPQQAFASGAYEKARCAQQMEQDEANPIPVERNGARLELVRFCRACELACPVAHNTAV